MKKNYFLHLISPFTLILLIFTLNSHNSFSQVGVPCTNGGFQMGDFTYWDGWTGFVPSGGGDPVLTYNGIVSGQHTIVTGNMNDQYSSCPMVSPEGGVYSAMLGNEQIGAEAERLIYYLYVTPANPSFRYQYHVVLQDQGHPASQQPRFQIEITDSAGNVIPCGFYDVVASGTIPGFSTLPANAPNNGTGVPIRYKCWSSVTVDLANYIGHTVKIQFTTNDCTQGGHFGYAYIDASCNPLQINAAFCPGSNSAVLIAPGGYQSYSWSTGQATQSVTIPNPTPGDTVFVTMTPFSTGGACTSVLSFVLQSALSFQTIWNYTQTCGGSLTFTDSSYALPNGSLPTNWSWNFGDPTTGAANTSTSQNPTHVFSGPGNYTVTLIASALGGCVDTFIQQITVPNQINNNPVLSNHNGVNVSCFGGNDGTATANGTGGFPPYTYSWNTNPVQNTQTATGLSANVNYICTITDSHGCIGYDTVMLNQPTLMTGTTTNTPSAICGNTGTGTANPNGGVGPYTYSWNTVPIQNTQTAINLSSGSHNVTVTDANGCQLTLSTVVGTIPGVTATYTTVGASCANNDGSATINPTGGTPPYTYSWNSVPGQNTQTATNLAMGDYVVSVIDAHGCVTTYNITVPGKNPTTMTFSQVNEDCYGQNIGSAIVNMSGGIPPFTYTWTPNVSNGNVANNLPIGIYTVTVHNQNGCPDDVHSFIIIQPDSIWVDAGLDVTIDLLTSTNLFATPNFPDTYTYLWDPSNGLNSPYIQNPVATPANTTTYTVTITNSLGCQASDNVTVFIIPFIYIPNAFSPNQDGQNDYFHLMNPDVIQSLDMKVYNRWGQLVYESNDPNFKWDGMFNGKPQEVDVYVWEMTYNPANTPAIINTKGNVSLVR